MARTLGLAFGALLLFDGLKDTVNPRLGFQLWNKYFRHYFPSWLNRDVDEYSHLSTSAIRYVTVWEMLMGVTMLWLASRARD